ncbi:MAG: cysteine desulfurase family protein [Bacteroidota bacterium]|jgi:cysteine desulfurase
MNSVPIYMDYHATTPVDERVLAAMIPFFGEHFGNAASTQHRFGWIAKEAVEAARTAIASAINARHREVIFTGGATESNNLAVKGIAKAYRGKGNHIITTAIEHKCVLDSCAALAHEGFRITYLPVDARGRVNPDDLKNAITENTTVVSVMFANNEIGTLQPMKEIGIVCRDHGIIFHTDATQAIDKQKIDVDDLNIHAMSFSSHKIYGPKGVGALYLRGKNPKINIVPQNDGGGQEFGLRSGTLNVPGIVGFGKAMQIATEMMEEEMGREKKLRDLLQEKLSLLGDISVNGSPEHRIQNNLSVTFHAVHAEMLMNELSDIAVSAGAACHSEETGNERFSHVLKAIGLDSGAGKSTVRFSLGRFTTDAEINIVAERVIHAVEKLRTYSLEGAQ